MSYIHKFKKPFEYEGETYDEMEFDFDALTGKDMLKIDSEMQMTTVNSTVPEFSQAYQAKLAARAAGIGSDVIEALPAHEFGVITRRARLFLLLGSAGAATSKGD